MKTIVRRKSVQSPVQKVGLRSSAPAFSGQEQVTKRPGRRPSSFAGMGQISDPKDPKPNTNGADPDPEDTFRIQI